MKYLLLLVIIGCVGMQCARGEDVNPVDELLSKHAEASQWENSAIIEGVTEAKISGYISPHSTAHVLINYQKAFDGKRWALRSENKLYDDSGQIIDKAAEVNTIILAPHEQFQMLAVRRYPHAKKDGPRIDAYQQISEATQRKTVLDASTDYDAPFAGYADGSENKTVFDLIKTAPDRQIEKQDIIDGAQVTVISGTTPYGRVRIWVDKSRDYNALRWTVTKTSNDRFGDKPLSEQKYSAPESATASWEGSLDRVTLQDVDGHWIPLRGEYVVKIAVADGRSQIFTNTINRASVKLHPDFDAQQVFELDIPDGTPIAYGRQLSGLAYECRGGKIVPSVNSDSMRSLDEAISAVKTPAVAVPASNPAKAPSELQARASAPVVHHAITVGYWMWGLLGIVLFAAAIVLARKFVISGKLKS